MIELPPKPKFTKDEITNAALTVAREKGIGAVSAREVAVVLVFLLEGAFPVPDTGFFLE